MGRKQVKEILIVLYVNSDHNPTTAVSVDSPKHLHVHASPTETIENDVPYGFIVAQTICSASERSKRANLNLAKTVVALCNSFEKHKNNSFCSTVQPLDTAAGYIFHTRSGNDNFDVS